MPSSNRPRRPQRTPQRLHDALIWRASGPQLNPALFVNQSSPDPRATITLSGAAGSWRMSVIVSYSRLSGKFRVTWDHDLPPFVLS